jgi:SAM-dependent methyltransferase
MNSDLSCRICQGPTNPAGSKWGSFKKQEFYLRRCPACGYAFVANPWTEYAEIYSDDYYAGQGADPLVDYHYELEHPDRTIRRYEWRGIATAVSSLMPVGRESFWLDFGCGNGGLVRYCRNRFGCRVAGFESGAIAAAAARHGVPIVTESGLEEMTGACDVVTAIEVLEHTTDPIATLRQIRRLLKPGGLFFYTTGNAAPYRDRLTEWRYVTPEIHISFFEPESLRRALVSAGFEPEFRRWLPGFTDILRFKILKNLRVRRASWLEAAAPWPVLARLAESRVQLFHHPLAWAQHSEPRERVVTPEGC